MEFDSTTDVLCDFGLRDIGLGIQMCSSDLGI